MAAPDLPDELRLALGFAPVGVRAALATLFALDARLGSIVAHTREPTIGLMRLTWWRDALTALDAGPPPAEPLLGRVAATLLPRGLSGGALASLAEGWEALIEETGFTAYAEGRGACLFGLAGALLGGGEEGRVAAAGRGWALADLARHHSEPAQAAAALAQAAAPLHEAMMGRWPRPLRPLGMLAALARQDVAVGAGALAPPASRGRLLRMLRHQWTGR